MKRLILASALIAAVFPVVAADSIEADRRPAARFELRLGGLQFDPAAALPELPEDWRATAATSKDLRLVQFDGPLERGALDALRKQGFEPVQYIPPHSYVVWGAAAHQIAHEKVRWTGDFAPAFRVQPRWRELDASPVEVRVLVYRGADVDAILQRIVLAGGAVTEQRVVNEEFTVAGFTLPGDRIRIVASLPGVYTVQVQEDEGSSRGEVADQISAGNVDGTNAAVPGYQAWLTSVGLDGSGVVAALVDEGVDEGHPDVAGGMLPCVGSTCSQSRSAHGTHTAGTILGDATSGTLSTSGFLRGLGVAPGAKLFEQDWRLNYQLPGGMLTLMNDSVANGAVLSNNSWGPSTTAHGYDLNTLLVDAGVRDADPGVPGNQQLIYVQAIDNGNGGVSSQGTPDDGKNLFTIGSTVAVVNPDGDPATNIGDLSFNSAHGPAIDGRTIPQMVAPGCYVDAPVAELPQGYVHEYRCGTSMATAHVSGAVALFVEAYRQLMGGDPSPAMVKAAFLPVAHDLEGALDANDVVMGHRPDSKQGWGRLNLAAVVDPQDPVLHFDAPTVFDFTGQEWRRVVTQVNPAEPLRVMLVWTDAPGHGLGGATPAWNNDLDLIVEAGGQTYLGNDFGVDGFSTTGGAADPMNNAEGVFLQTVSGEATLRVAATDINSNGVPQHGDSTDQDFAIVCYNCALAPDFALSLDPEPLELCAATPLDVPVVVEQLAGFGDPVTLTAVNVPAGAMAQFSATPVTPPASSVLTLAAGAGTDGDYTLHVQGDSPTLSRSVSLGLKLRTAAPGIVPLTAPLDAAIDVAPRPVLQWNAVSWSDRYLVEIAPVSDFSQLIYSAVEAGPSHDVSEFLRQQTTYYWRVRATNACGYGAVSATFSFTTVDVPDLLLVDDDYDLPNEQPEYTAALNSLGVTYDVWDVWAVHIGIEPEAETFAPYENIIWWSGKEEIFAGPGDASERILPDWLDHGGCMLISSIDYVLQHKGVTDFMRQRLGVGAASEDTGMTEVTGQGAVFGGLGPYTLVNQNPDFRDSISPDLTAALAFAGDLGDAGVTKDGLWYRTAFLGFGVESTGAADKEPLLNAFLTWCGGLALVDGDGDGVLNGDDCRAGDANAWGIPNPVTDFMLGKGAVGFSWSEPLGGGGSTYRVLRSDNPTDFYNASCVLPLAEQTEGPEDPDVPAEGDLFFYLVGAQSECGVSTLGNNLDGTPRYGTACDAETEWW